MGWTGLTCYGSNLHKTPVIDAVKAQGEKFTNACAAWPVCDPAPAAITAGPPARLHVTVWREAAGEPPAWMRRRLIPPVTRGDLSQSQTTLSEVLKLAGYLTLHAGKWHLGGAENYPEAHAFDVNTGETLWGFLLPILSSFQRRFGHQKEFREVPGLALGRSGHYLTDRLTDDARKLIEQAGIRPFFLKTWYCTVRTPMEARPEIAARYQRKLAQARKNPWQAVQTNPCPSSNPTNALQVKALDFHPRPAASELVP